MNVKKITKNSFILGILSISTAFANGEMHSMSPSASAPNKSAFSFYAGFGAGYGSLHGKRRDIAAGVTISPKTKLEGEAANALLFAGMKWQPNMKFSASVEPYFSFSNFKTTADGVVVNSYLSHKISTNHSFGLDLKPTFHLHNGHSVFALLGIDFRNFKFSNTSYTTIGGNDFRFYANKSKYLTGFSYGAGYEYEMDKSTVGLRLKHTIYGRKTFSLRDSAGTLVSSSIKPNIFSALLTFSYRFKG